MLRFFRQIRQRLLTDNKISKYLLYAVGEILLVMVGILLALQVDTWNESRKDHIYKEQLVEALKFELYQAQNDLKQVIEMAEKSVYYGALFREIVTTDNKSVEVDSIKKLANLGMEKILFKLTLSAYEESRSSGKLSLINDFDLLSAYSEIFTALEDYHHHFPLAGQAYYIGPAWLFRQKYGTLGVLTGEMEIPKSFRVSEDQYWNILQDPITYGMLENHNILNENMLSSLRNIQQSVDKVITSLQEIQ